MESTHCIIVLTAVGYSGLINGDEARDWAEFQQVVSDKIQKTLPEGTKFTFIVSQQPSCCLENQKDYANMLLLCSLTQSHVINIQMEEKFTPAGLHPSQPCHMTNSSTEQVHNNNHHERTLPFNLNEPPPEDLAVPVQSFMFGDHQFHSFSATNNRTVANPTSNTEPSTHQTPMQPTHSVPQTMTSRDDIFFYKTSPASPALDKPKAQSRRRTRQGEVERGEFYPGVTTDFPVYEISPEQEAVVLRSATWVNYIRKVGQEFRGGVTEFRSKLVMYAAKIGFKFNYIRNDGVYVHARCALNKSENCGWFVKGAMSSITATFIIKTAELQHSCALSVMGPDSQRIGCRIIGDLITDAIRAKPTLTATELKQDLLTYYGFTIPYEKVWRGVEVARANVFGGYADSFDELRWYHKAILKTNPGSQVFLETDSDGRFSRFFLAFNASLQGFRKCRPMLFVDGTFMKTKYKGTLLAATAKDGNNGLFPVAIAIVEGENTANWNWFITKIKEIVQHPQQVMFVSDRAGGLMAAFDDVYDKPLHFFCLYHLMQNLRGMYKGKKYSDIFKSSMCKLLKEAAYAPNKHFYEIAIRKFKHRGGPEAVHFLQDLPPNKWAVAFAPDVHRYGELTSNAAESFNSWILEARALPITFMIDCIRMKLMKWFTERREEANKWTGALTKRAEQLWNENDSLGENWKVNVTNQFGIYEVVCPASAVVDLNSKKCSCYQWQIRGFPCCHAIAVIKRARWHIRQVLDKCFFVDTYKEIYAENIYPIPSTEKFEGIDLNGPEFIKPPVIRRQPRRPRMKRFRTDTQVTNNANSYVADVVSTVHTTGQRVERL